MDPSEHYLTYNSQALKNFGGAYTAREIASQPALWKSVWKNVYSKHDAIEQFLNEASSNPSVQIILTGAGSSSFVGQVVEDIFRTQTQRDAKAIPTTDLVTHFKQKIDIERPLFLVSFARSGNSPESTAVVDIAGKYYKYIYHLIITCNDNGNLAQAARQNLENKSFIYTLPSQAEDQGLAMTASFTGMALSAILIANISRINELKTHVDTLAHYGENIIKNQSPTLKKIAEKDFNRIVFLGSGTLLSIANESHLKVQELTDGQVIGKHDSFLGFRHGPRAVLDDKTLLVYLFSNNKHVLRYETDLAAAIHETQTSVFTIGVAESSNNRSTCNLPIFMNKKSAALPEEFLAIASVLPAQMIGFFSSIKLGLKPDTPSINGSISRVVEGVKIYPLEKEISKQL